MRSNCRLISEKFRVIRIRFILPVIFGWEWNIFLTFLFGIVHVVLITIVEVLDFFLVSLIIRLFLLRLFLGIECIGVYIDCLSIVILV
jgi:hypothetical protein